LPVGEARVRALLGFLERLAVLGLLADRYGDLSGVVPAVLTVLPAGARSLRSLGRGARVDLGSHVAQPAGHSGRRNGVRTVCRAGARAVRRARGGGAGSLARATGNAV